jgi:ABC-type multidrug transport system ATPase subunit
VAPAPIVSVRGLVKRYGPRTVVDGVDFEVRPGEVLALLGPNGAGKTTVLKCLLGLVRPDGGEIWIGGRDARREGARVRSLLGYVPQRTDPADEVTGQELLRLVADLRCLDGAATARAVEQAGAQGLLDRPLGILSGGQLQRVVLAQALLGDPPLVLFDEPTVSLDPVAQHEYMALLRALRDRGKAVLLSSHLLWEVEQVADRALVLDAGRPVALWPASAWRSTGLESLFLETVTGSAPVTAIPAPGRGEESA